METSITMKQNETIDAIYLDDSFYALYDHVCPYNSSFNVPQYLGSLCCAKRILM